MSSAYASHHHQPSLHLLQAPCRINHFARFEEELSHPTLVEAVRDSSTALIIGQPSPRSLIKDLSDYVSTSEISFYRVILVSGESAERTVRESLGELKFLPLSRTFEQLVADIASDVSQFSKAIDSPIVQLNIILQDRSNDREDLVELGPEDLGRRPITTSIS